ncbi:MAG TPA: antibiotic biosynthesis monooxygenase [Ideonella sp.]|uniref:antibiotic biosynthesis monooxygenase n=1 Tax=Ideonella sp. TaxID=1929293 RepID=UPI002CD9ECAC|nr:antibiotic biosynthesis monooxygenase [Ideonella sp.]HSI47068.1 antibiotic biosynthesis monooxygenase [Ideonella sp.]
MNLNQFLAASTLILGSLFQSSSHAQAQPVPFVRLADLQIDPSRLEAFKVASAQHAEAVMRDEPGALALHAVAEKGNPAHIRVFEMYQDADAYASHLRTPHFEKFRAVTDAMTTSRTLIDVVPVLLGAKPSMPSNPVVRTADLQIDPARLDAYKAAVSEEIEASIRVEPGVAAIYAVALKDAPNQVRFIEIYADEDAYLRHRDTPHFRKYLETTGPMITGRNLIEATPVVIAVRPPALKAATAPAFYLSEFELTDAEGIKPYSAAVESTFAPFGGRYAVRGGQRSSLEGAPAQRIVMIVFPSLAQAQAWYDSPAYRALRPIRQRSATSRVFIVEGVAP